MPNNPMDNGHPLSALLPMAIGYLALLALVGGLGYWSATAQIAGAVIAPGVVQVQTNRQIVQHLEGGVVAEILAKDGDYVESGEVLLRLDGTRLRSELTIVEGKLQEVRARSARLEAERDNSEIITYPDELLVLAEASPAIANQLLGQSQLYLATRATQSLETDLLGEQIEQIGNRLEGTNAQLDALLTQRELIAEELENQQALLARGLAQASRVMDLRGNEASVLGQIGKTNAEIAELKGQEAGLRIELVRVASQRQEEAISELRDLRLNEIELAERQGSLTDVLSHLEVRSPVSGIIYGSEVFANQSVVKAGAPIMYVIPQDQPLVISARVDSISIDQVKLGQDASFRFPVFDIRMTPELLGYVSRVSADILTDESSGLAYYAVELLPKEGELDKLGDQVLLPGMPVEAFLKTGDRSPLSYLVKPFTDYFVRAFRE